MTDDFTWVGERFRSSTHTQSYGSSERIDGVRLIDLRTFHDEGGDFCEIARFAGNAMQNPEFVPAQISWSSMAPGAIKAWHLHRNQDDLWFVPPTNQLLIGLLDVRPESPSYESKMRFTLGTGEAKLLYIPKGVAHGVANLTQEVACVIYFVNQAFDPNQPDEHRLPHDLLGADFWSIRPG